MFKRYFTSRIEREKKIIEAMIEIYCRNFHGFKEGFCHECEELLDYSHLKLEKCPFGDNKPVCNKCSVHCYKDEMKHKIKQVMKYSGPRMLYYHPVMSLYHFIDKIFN